MSERIYTVGNMVKIPDTTLCCKHLNSCEIVFVGKMDYEPNVVAVSYFVQNIFPLLLPVFPDLKFIVVGAHPDKKLKVAGLKPNSLYRHDCPSNIEILPFNISMDELIGYYCTCKAFLFVSKYEGFGIPILEAMACGCKLIVSDVTSIPEVCGNNGVYIDPNSEKELSEAINSIDKQYVVREKYIRQLKKYADWSVPAHKILELLLKD